MDCISVGFKDYGNQAKKGNRRGTLYELFQVIIQKLNHMSIDLIYGIKKKAIKKMELRYYV